MRGFLSVHQFNVFERRRIQSALTLLGMAEDHASRLIGLGQRARTKDDLILRGKADELIASAIQFRVNSFLARLCLYLKWMRPSWAVPLPAFELRFRELLQSFAQMDQHGSWSST
jgi:hypothetical protein